MTVQLKGQKRSICNINWKIWSQAEGWWNFFFKDSVTGPPNVSAIVKIKNKFWVTWIPAIEVDEVFCCKLQRLKIFNSQTNKYPVECIDLKYLSDVEWIHTWIMIYMWIWWTYHIRNNIKRVIFKWEFRINIQVLHNIICENLQKYEVNYTIRQLVKLYSI